MNKLFLSLSFLSFSLLSAQSNQTESSNPPTDQIVLVQRGDEPLQGMAGKGQYPAAYNQAGNTNLCQSRDVYGDVSYLYWAINQEGLDLATTGEYLGEIVDVLGSGGFAVFQDFDYTSGFKVGVGSNLNVDDWSLDAEYTYMRQSTSTSQAEITTADPGTLGVYNFTGWFFDNYFGQGLVAKSFQSKWKFGLDWVDLMMKRPYYLGRRLIATPSMGLRGSWIRQALKITAYDGFYDNVNQGTLISRNNSHSWAVGPRGLVDLRWLMGLGFRLQGNFGTSILFTQFTKVTHLAPAYDEDVGGKPFKMTHYNCIRPMLEGNLGLGWGRYFSQNRYHFDLSATYDFNFLWGQNIMKYMVNLNGFGRGASPYDLLMYGLTIKSRFDF